MKKRMNNLVSTLQNNNGSELLTTKMIAVIAAGFILGMSLIVGPLLKDWTTDNMNKVTNVKVQDENPVDTWE